MDRRLYCSCLFSFNKGMWSKSDKTAPEAVCFFDNLCTSCHLGHSSHLFLLYRTLIEQYNFGPLTVTVDWSLARGISLSTDIESGRSVSVQGE